MSPFISAILATILISLLSLAGVVVLFLKTDFIKKIVVFLVALSAGTMIGAAFLHLIPEALTQMPIQKTFILTIGGFLLFFLVERLLHWRHCHKAEGECHEHTFAYMNLLGDAFHNFLDGLLVIASFVINPVLGWTTVWAIASHELPQEIGDFGVLLHGGLKRGQALWLNFLVSLTAILGVFIGYWLSSFSGVALALLPITAGGFIYISAVDLVPELHQQTGSKLSKNILHFIFFVLGVGIMFLFKD